MKRFAINIQFVKYCLEQKYFSHLAYFAKLKYKYKNGIHYKYLRSSIARATNHSHKLISKHVKFFLERGWCMLQHGHLHFRKWKHVMAAEEFKGKWLIYVEGVNTNDTKSIKTALHAMLIDNKIRQREFVKEKLKDRINPMGRDATLKYKSALRFFKKYPESGITTDETSSRLTLSVSNLCEMFYCSRATVQNIKKRLQAACLFRFLRRKTIMGRGITQHHFYNYLLPAYGRSVYMVGDVCIKNESCIVYRMSSEGGLIV